MVLGTVSVRLSEHRPWKYGSLGLSRFYTQKGCAGQLFEISGASIEDWVEVGIVVHLQLTIEAEASFSGEDLGPEGVETGGEIVALGV